MSVVVPVATSVGLQLLLQPYAQGIGRIACTGAGVLYPAYASFRAAEALATTREGDAERLRTARWEACKWLCYWGCYGALSLAERLLDNALPWVPYYQTIKFAFLLWLQVPRYEGAQRIYRELLQPYLQRLQPAIDDVLLALYYSARQPTIVAALEAAHCGLAQVPVLEWFVRGPDGRPAPRPASRERGSFLTSSADTPDS